MAHRWGMAVDLDRCTGCEACVDGLPCREQHPDRRRRAGGARPRDALDSRRALLGGRVSRRAVKFRPVMCQQCDAAPCEPVCPTYASHHTEEGLNAQVYNRCIGTRYCANACPYNVRFFNFFNPQWDKPLHLQLNPDVSVREVGVMEKCTFCVQRIKAAKIAGEGREARAEGRRDQAGLRAVVPGQGARVRRPERSRERGLAAVAIAARHASCSKTSARSRRSPISQRQTAGMNERSEQAHHRRSAASAAARRRGGSTLLVAVPRQHRRCAASAPGCYQMYYGIGVTGINWPVFWGFYITNFVFWIGISHAGTLISAILRLVNAGWRRPVTRCAEVITVFALMIGAMFPIIHLGRPVAVLLAGAVSRASGRSGRTSARRWCGTSSRSTPT